MASNKPSDPSARARSHIEECEWVVHVQMSLEEEIEEEDIKTPVSIFGVPEALASTAPEAYVPQLFAFGPYHHWEPKLYDMQRNKIAAARRTKSRIEGPKFQELVEHFVKREHKIRGYYHRHLNHSKETLAWMMAIDACFLLEILNNYTESGRTFQKQLSTMLRKGEKERMKMGFNMVLRDMLMLENQIPLYVLRKLMNLLCSKESGDDELSLMLAGFVNEISPFKTANAPLVVESVANCAHLLEILYNTIVPKEEEIVDEADDDVVEENVEKDDDDDIELGDTSHVKNAYGWFKKLAPNLDGPLNSVKRVFVSGPVRLLVKFPWKVVTALPVFSLVKQPVESYFSKMVKEKSDDGSKVDKSVHIDKPPLVDEITIPSVTELAAAGVRFACARGDIATIEFDARTSTLYLPVVTVDVNTEVAVRNLVAYEVSVVSGPLVFTRYTELMNGIVDTAEDVKILRGRGIVVNRMKSDKEAARLWNGTSKSVRLTKVKFLDTAIRDVNRFYRGRWSVRSKGFMRKYVFGSWQVLTFLAAALLLCLTCVQAFCSVYTCNAQVTKITSVGQ